MTNEERNQSKKDQDRSNQASTSRNTSHGHHEEEHVNDHDRDHLTIFDHLIQSDPALAMTLQEQQRATYNMTNNMLIPSTSQAHGYLYDREHNYNYDSSSDEASDSDFEFEPQMEIQEDNEEDAQEEPIEPNELEELISMGEALSEDNKRGLTMSQVSIFLSSCKYLCFKSCNGIEKCVICQVEYEEGELLVALDCDHPYHADCISKWLQVKRACPMCSSLVSIPKYNKKRKIV